VVEAAVAQEVEAAVAQEVVAPVEEADRVLELGRAVAAGLELALAQLQGQVLARAREPRSVLDRMHL
jgi:hypothetical protein